MTATRPLWSAQPVSLHRLVDLGDTYSLETLRHLLGPHPTTRADRAAAAARRRRRRAGEFAVAVLCVLAVVALFALLATGLSVPVDASDPGLLGG